LAIGPLVEKKCPLVDCVRFKLKVYLLWMHEAIISNIDFTLLIDKHILNEGK